MMATTTNEKANGLQPLAISKATSAPIFPQSREPIKAFCTAKRTPRIHGRENAQWTVVVEKCPHCNQRHVHGGGTDEVPILGDRAAHCVDGRGGYELVLKGGAA